jgi:hypothetical protein
LQYVTTTRHGKPAYNLHRLGVKAPKDLKTVDVRFGVAQGPWKTVIKTAASARLGAPPNLEVVISDPIEKADGRVVVHVARKGKGDDLQFRLVAEDEQGREHFALQSSAPAVDDLAQLTVTFGDLRLKQIKHFRLQTRPREWVRFRNVSLQSGQHSDVQLVAPAAEELLPPPTKAQAKNQAEQIQALQKAYDIADAQYQAGHVGVEEHVAASDAILQARLAAAVSNDERVLVLQKLLDNRRQMEKYTEERYNAGAALEADLLRAKAARAAAENRWNEEEAATDRQPPPLPARR